MSVESLPKHITERYEVYEWQHPIAILQQDFKDEFNEVINLLTNFQLTKTDILKNGGRKSPIASKLDSELYNLGWHEKWFDIENSVDGQKIDIPTHGIDCYKNRVGLEIEWNNKDPFFDRDLNNFRLLFEKRAVSVGIIITRCTSLQKVFNELGKGTSYGASTTHMNKLIPKIESGGSGGCPVLAFGISEKCYIDI